MTDDDVLRTALKDFKRSVEITRDVRFQANLRLSRRQRGSSYIVAMLSLYVIALSLLPNILELNQSQNQILLACSVVLSVFVIFTSLIDGAQNFYHQGELLHQCARKIATVHYNLKSIDLNGDRSAAKIELDKCQDEYRRALDECPINHDNVDFYRELGAKPHLFPDNYPRSEGMRPFVMFWYRAIATVSGGSWMTIHILAFVAVSLIVYLLVINGSALKTVSLPH